MYSSNDLAQPGVIVNYTSGRDMLVLGEIDDRASRRVCALRELLTAAGMHSPHSGDIRQSVWDKLLLNFGSSLCVPLGEPAGVPAPTLEAVHALVARLAARKGLYSSP